MNKPEDIAHYNNLVDGILWDMIGNKCFKEGELSDIIDIVAATIYLGENHFSQAEIKKVVTYLIFNKYEKIYSYNFDSEFNATDAEDVENVDIDVYSDEYRGINQFENHHTSSASAGASESDDASESASESESEMSFVIDEVACANYKQKPLVDCYTNPELAMSNRDKIALNAARDLISHRHDYVGAKFIETEFIRRKKIVDHIKTIPQFEQKSIEWLTQRAGCLTATAVSTALDEDPYKYPAELLLDKCGLGEPFIENQFVHHGKKYEEIGNMFYGFRNNIQVAEYGLLQHPSHTFIGASPDGICEKYTAGSNSALSKLIGRMLEIKFPYCRKILKEGKLDGDICPHYYHVQVQTQLFVTGLDECDFLQCKIEEYDTWEDYIADTNKQIPGLSKRTNLERGCLIQLLRRDKLGDGDPKMCLYNAQYIYPPKLHMTNEEIEKWVSNELLQFQKHKFYNEYVVDRIIYWRLSEVACHLIKADREWFNSKIPLLEQFWAYVEFYKQYPEKITALQDIINEYGKEQTKQIFEYVHKDYLTVNKRTHYKPLYQKEGKWRQIYNEKKNKYKGYNRKK